VIFAKINHHLIIARARIKTFGLFHGIRSIYYHFFYKRLTDAVMGDYAYEKSSYRYIAQFYRKHNAKFKFQRPANEIEKNQLIYWTCWLQGMENAPDMVKACYNSARRNAAGHRIIVITYENLNKYIVLPEYIIKKYEAGYITATHFSDILRVYLLYIYGGVWFDATVFFTKEIPINLLNLPVFFFKDILKNKYCPISNWFISARNPHNILLYNILCILCEYWNTNNTIIDYFIFHYFVNIIIESNQECRELFDRIPYISNQPPHYLQSRLLFSQFNTEIWENIKSISFCHKLTYKIDHQQNDITDTYFNYIADTYSKETVE
jgi:mannosyltransferase OCH1-like enzyme